MGLIIGNKNKGKEAILDLGLQRSIKGSSLYAVAKGAIDGGLKLNVSEKVLPSEERVKGKHISEYSKLLKKNKETYEKQYSKHIKQSVDPEEIDKKIEEIKNKILDKK